MALTPANGERVNPAFSSESLLPMLASALTPHQHRGNSKNVTLDGGAAVG